MCSVNLDRKPDEPRRSGMIRRVRATALAVSAVVGLMLTTTGVALAATTFTGGPDSDGCPLYVPNDHTAFAIKWSATGGTLTPGTQYYVKMRLNTSAGTGGTAIRGWTWNGSGTQWVQERDDWTKFPVVTADASGNLASTWTFCKFGDEARSGTYYVIVSLTPLPYAAGQTLNGTVMPAVTVVNMASGGYWVHNGVATGAQATKRAEATDHADGTRVWALSRTEINTVDDDSNGTVDDEDYGPAGKTGDFRFGLPVSSFFDIFLNRVAWGPGQNISGAIADVDLAVGATDTGAPDAVTGLTATPKNGGVDLDWSAGGDNVGVAAYNIFRWNDPTPIGGVTYYSSARVKVATVSSGTAYSDTGLTNGATYRYCVRAVDAAGNVGPRSGTAGATPDGTPPVTDDNAGGGWHAVPFQLVLTPTDSGSGMAGGLATTEYSTDDGATWETGTTLDYTARWRRGGGSGSYPVLVRSTDAAGNVETPRAVRVNIDTGAPTCTDDANGQSFALPCTVHFGGADAASGVAEIWYSLDGGAWTQGMQVSVGTLGDHTLAYYAIDAVGNYQVGYNVCGFEVTGGGGVAPRSGVVSRGTALKPRSGR